MADEKAGDLRVEPGSRVTLHLALTFPDGTEALTTFGDEPERFRVGDGTLSAGLEAIIIGKRKGARESLLLAPDQAFGAWLPENRHALPRTDFSADPLPEPGVVMAFETPAGERIPGTIVEADEQRVTVDFNHPLAGQSLNFRYEIVDIKTGIEH